ncbi:hypothetical protein [Cronbergia sp. UHCC 0137]|uniref:hypothetical protein n=1 Tax=Cronbergia sp. UHCC 0137 TaxID=3110239 RepID=UPI003A4C5F6B
MAPFQISATKIGINEVGTTERSTFQISSTKVDIHKTGVVKPDISQISTSKVSFPSLITLNNFFSQSVQSENFVKFVHNTKPTSFNTLNSTAPTIWQSLFDPTFNLTLQITDLPTGQLAEAQITQFDQYDRPNGGTLLIDHDANGAGWFIDPTPWENSEFAQTITDTAYQATTGDAFGKYDLLTTILHETGHLFGIINGNPGFDSNVQTLNGKKVFVGKDFTANLSLDGSHLDATVHPYDLMNNTLAPGVRKLPSLLNQQIINTIRSVGFYSIAWRMLAARFTNTLCPTGIRSRSTNQPTHQDFFRFGQGIFRVNIYDVGIFVQLIYIYQFF